MALFVPHSGSPYANGLSSLAEAIAGVPMNRARLQQMELNAANVAADNARQDAAAAESLRRWNIENARAAEEARQKALLAPLTVAKTRQDLATGAQTYEFNNQRNPQLLTQGELDIAAKEEANRQAGLINPLTVTKTQAEADKAVMEAGDMATIINQRPELAASLADTLYGSVHKAMPEWSVKDLLKTGGSALPNVGSYSGGEFVPPPSLPGMADTGMDYPGMAGSTAGMDEISRRMRVEDNARVLAERAVMNKDLNPGAWLKDTSKAMIAAEPSVAASGVDYGDTDTGRAQAIVASIREKQRQGVALTPADADNYAMAMAVLSPTQVSTVMGNNGKPITNVTQRQIFTDGAAPGAMSPPAAGGTAVSPAAAAGSGAVSANGVPVRTQSANGVTVTTLGENDPKPHTEYNSKIKIYSTRAGTALQQYAPLIGLDLANNIYDPSKAKVSGGADALQMLADRKLTEWLGPEARGALATGPQEQYAGAQTGILNPLVRFDSGAATPEIDYARAQQEFIPGPNDEPQTVVDKIVRTRAVLAAMEEIFQNTNIDPSTASDDQIRAWKADGTIDSTIAKYQMLFTQEPPRIINGMSQVPQQAPNQPPQAPNQPQDIPPAGWDPEDWKYLTEQEKALLR